MKFTCDTKAFIAAMAVAGRVVPQKAPWPILLNLKIVTNDDRITLIGSDSDVTFEMDIPAQIEIEGAACIPFAPLAKFASATKAGSLVVEEANDQVTLKASRSKITLSTGELGDYPNYRPVEGDTVALDGVTFCHALRFCASAVEANEVKYHIGGAHFREEAGSVDVWGTDGNVFHHASLADLGGIGGGGTVPLAAAAIILSIAEKAETIRFAISERGWHLEAGSIRAWGKVIDGIYPDMKRVASQFDGWEEFTIVGRDDIANAITVATCGSEADSNKATSIVVRSADGGPVVFRGRRGGAGVVHAGRAELEALGRKNFSGVVSSRYLSGALSGMKNDDFSLACDADGRGLRVEPAQKSATLTMSAVIMAIRASEAEMADV